MNNFDFKQEWEFVTAETHNEKPRKNNLIKREILFGLQFLLSTMERKKYLALKEIYCKEKSKPGHKTS